MTKLEYIFKTDTLFKMLFVKHTNLLKQLVSELLEIRLKSSDIAELSLPREALLMLYRSRKPVFT